MYDKTCIFQYDPETKRQSMHWKSRQSHRKKNAYEQVKIQSNDDFFDNRWVIYIDWMPEGQTVNQIYFKNVSKTLHEHVQQRGPDFWNIASWILHQKNVPAHNTLSVKHYLAKNNIPVMEHHCVTFSSRKWNLCSKEPGLSPWMQWKQKRRSLDSWSASNIGHGKTKCMWLKLCVTVEGSPHVNAPPSSLLSQWQEISNKINLVSLLPHLVIFYRSSSAGLGKCCFYSLYHFITIISLSRFS